MNLIILVDQSSTASQNIWTNDLEDGMTTLSMTFDLVDDDDNRKEAGEEGEEEKSPDKIVDPRIANRSPRKRAAQIAAEDLQIINLTIQGFGDKEIMQKLGLTEANYRYRLNRIQAKDMERVLSERTPQAQAFIYQRTLEKLSDMELNATLFSIIIDNKR
jgi:hypothetical protein